MTYLSELFAAIMRRIPGTPAYKYFSRPYAVQILFQVQENYPGER